LSGNTLLPLIFYSFRTPVIMLWKRYIQLHGKDKLYENIRSIYEQVSQRNVTEAVRVFQEAVNQTISGGVSIYYE